MLYSSPLWMPFFIIKSLLFPLDLTFNYITFAIAASLSLIATILRGEFQGPFQAFIDVLWWQITLINHVFWQISFIGWSRFNNTEYRQFIDTLYHCQLHWNEDTETLQTALKQYDFGCRQKVSPWPIGYRWNRSRLFKELHRTSPTKANGFTPPRSRSAALGGNFAPTPHKTKNLFNNTQNFGKPTITPPSFDFKSFIIKLLQNVLRKTLLCWLSFPSSIEPLQWFHERQLVTNRARLVNNHCAQRARLLTKDGNTIDSMFIDRRIGGEDASKSHYLVICCESGFYETGLLLTALEAGYSALGYNVPGCGESAGHPTIEEQLNAIDVVIHYACDRLKFKFGRILIFGSSTGCLTATWAAKNYPEIRGLFLHEPTTYLPPLLNKLPSSIRE